MGGLSPLLQRVGREGRTQKPLRAACPSPRPPPKLSGLTCSCLSICLLRQNHSPQLASISSELYFPLNRVLNHHSLGTCSLW